MSRDWLGYRARVSPEKPALIWQGQNWTYSELNQQVNLMCVWLSSIGVSKGGHVAVLMPNCMEFIILIHALTRLRAILVPLNNRLTPDEIYQQYASVDCTILIHSNETQKLVKMSLFSESDKVFSIESAPDFSQLGELSHFDGNDSEKSLDLTTIQSIIFTSGTTGMPKGAVISFGNHYWSATGSAFRLGHDPKDIWLLNMPLYHIGGMAIVMRCCLYGTTIFLQQGFNVDVIHSSIKDFQVSLISLVPTMLYRLLEKDISNDWSKSLRCILLGGAAASNQLLKKCKDLQIPVATTYGLTEATSQVATSLYPMSVNKMGSVGKPLLFMNVSILTPERKKCYPGEIGEISINGPAVMKGYFHKGVMIENRFINESFQTGDYGYLDEEGDLWIVQRRSDLVVSGGENIYPSEVERIINSIPGVKDACAIGVSSAEWGQILVAVVERKTNHFVTSKLISSYLRENLAGYKNPKQILFIGSLPRTSSGKIMRGELERWVLQKLNQEE